MRASLRLGLGSRVPRIGRLWGTSLLLSVLLVGVAWADTPQQTPKAKGEPKADPASKVQPKSEPVTPPKTDPASPSKTEPAPKAGSKLTPRSQRGARSDPAERGKTNKSRGKSGTRSLSKRSKTAQGFTMNPNAKFACDQMTAKLSPVWRGGSKLTFPFDIRNEGTEALRIRARGG